LNINKIIKMKLNYKRNNIIKIIKIKLNKKGNVNLNYNELIKYFFFYLLKWILDYKKVKIKNKQLLYLIEW